MKQWKFDQQLQIKLVFITLCILFIFSIISNFIEKIFIISEKWEIPLIFASLSIITIMLFTLYNIEHNVEMLIKKEGLGFQRYKNYNEFYKDLERVVSTANNSLDLTHIRNEPPSCFISGKSYFEKVEKWCQKHKECPVRRIIAINNNEMLQWAKELFEMTENNKNFFVRVCDWKLKFPMINMSIIDGNNVFLAITADFFEKTPGIQIKDPITTKYFIDYYENLWYNSEPISQELLDRRFNEMKLRGGS